MVGSHMLVRFDEGDNDRIDEDLEERLMRALEQFFVESDVVIVSDYDCGIVTPRLVKHLARLQAATPRVLVADSKHLDTYRRVGITAVKPNYGEVTHLLNVSPCGSCIRAEQIIEHGEQILDLTGAQIAAVTLDTEGALIFERGRPPYRTYARPRPHSHAAGAGDTFLATFALALAAGALTPAAAELASGAAAIVVSRDGTTTIGASELREYFTAEIKITTDPERLQSRLEYYRQEGRRIVFTNGVFDILHRGHITYLNRAKALGDILIVGVNSDESVARLKGPSRPINSLEDREQVLAALSCIDHIVAFGDDTPAELIRTIRPDVYVKGGDYTRQSLPETPLVEELGGTVHILPYVQDQSTTGIIERIREVYDWPSTVPQDVKERVGGTRGY
jgi:D-beta-D-heptose 7-phosphate kinase/D-beta-D-heptose 1-phosphate adenosyltransferase